MKKCLLSAIAILCVEFLWAVPATPYPFQITQPDGSVITVKLCGDEHASYYTTIDGTPLRKLDNGFFMEDYTIQDDYIRRATQRRKDVQSKAQATTYPLNGSPKSLVLLVGFKDLPFKQDLEDFNALLNESGYSYNKASGSCRDYFIAASDSIFQPQFDVYGPFTLSNNMEYYGGDEGDRHDKNAHVMIIEACQMAVENGVDLDEYDTDNNGVLDNVFVYYAGHNQAEGAPDNTIWPHMSNLSVLDKFVDGKKIASYACTSEYSGSTGTRRASIGTFCHEFGHVLGLPDFYDTDYKHYTVSNWDIMCSGSYNDNGRTPPTYSAYERFYLGWLTPQQLTEKGQYTLTPLTQDAQAYLIASGAHNLKGDSPSPNEFFLLEYRTRTGWDAYLPGQGMLIWHIDYLPSAWANNTPNNGPSFLRIHLEEANGISWKDRGSNENGKSSDPYPGTQKVTTFLPKLHDGTVLSDQNLFDIAENNGWISFIYQGIGDVKLVTDVQELSLTTTVSDNRKIEDWTPQSFILTAEGLNEDSITISTKNNFFVALGEEHPSRGSKEWKRILGIKTNGNSTTQKVWVSFIPTQQSCDEITSQLTITTIGATATVGIKAYSPRPTYVTAPQLKPTTNISPFSFKIAWKPVEDAVVYYATLYQSEEGESDFLQGFESFNDFSNIIDEGWKSNITRVTTSAKSEGTKSLYFKETGDQITSETYFAPVKAISFWVNAFASKVTEVGYIDLEAWNGNEWVTSNEWRTTILSSHKSKVVKINFNVDDNFTQFRLTFTDTGGAGLALDAFKVTCSKYLHFIYKGKQLSIDAIDLEEACVYEFTNLLANTTYHYCLQASDVTKGCEEHITELSSIAQVTTLAAGSEKDENQLPIAIDTINYDAPTHVVYVSNPQSGDMLYIHNVNGKLVYSCPVIAGVYEYVIPVEQLQKRSLYLIKYVVNGKLKRKQAWAKFVL